LSRLEAQLVRMHRELARLAQREPYIEFDVDQTTNRKLELFCLPPVHIFEVEKVRHLESLRDDIPADLQPMLAFRPLGPKYERICNASIAFCHESHLKPARLASRDGTFLGLDQHAFWELTDLEVESGGSLVVQFDELGCGHSLRNIPEGKLRRGKVNAFRD